MAPWQTASTVVRHLRAARQLQNPPNLHSITTANMLARATFRAASAPTLVARRGFQSTRAQMASPYHYPEGPRSNLPFDPLKKGFAFKFWGFMGTGFALPFLLAVWQTKKNKP
ncbi:hypothetical protein HBI56_120950 [Parastagonospora nodorum]|uniref:Cytochrome c oxidase subunit 8, mitochondrial n=1 Tax=Phaeosphaeria nodorum (strain SN15 / ATCC MYA-4574 / FGSC 10173) TaxID=321614 RepID=A0A7U2FBN6_PHANO|nr:hypothetical protein HBH56_053790 [Parastagonospora nodorum]QRD02277.1 hypothetical protein JI435_052480 [Parastagonospora nodorum SN15]KAH3935579.1 hypothetical protein HBH54_039590 [Parastagonospora nodorum]KAH3948480.1 hypothetical protein HBH53_099700 [Parastagonospora nodorum]KAH3969919.1 hypothetical protein HBH51_119730 [Parastagonospora nodorum]